MSPYSLGIAGMGEHHLYNLPVLAVPTTFLLSSGLPHQYDIALLGSVVISVLIYVPLAMCAQTG